MLADAGRWRLRERIEARVESLGLTAWSDRMHYLFKPDGPEAELRRLAQGTTLFAFDFDGTLAGVWPQPCRSGGPRADRGALADRQPRQ
jgi:hypothetical protein